MTNQLCSIELKDFRCFDNLELDLDADFGLFLLTGRNEKMERLGANGIGKSTLFEAVCWCLYGKTSKGLKAETLRSKDKTGGYCVTLRFTCNEGHSPCLTHDDHVISRSWKPNGLTWNGEEATDDEIQEFIGLTFDQFLFTVYFAQQAEQFVDLTPKGKADFLSAIFNLDVWLECADECKKQANGYKIEVSKCESSIEAAKETQISRQNDIAHYNKQGSEWAEKQDAKIHDLQRKRAEIIPGDPVDVAELNATLAETKEILDIAKSARGDLKNKLSQAQMDKYHADTTITQIANQVEQFLTINQCPSCLQGVPDEHKNKISEQLLAQADEYEQKLSDTIRSITRIESEIAELEPSIKDAEQYYGEIFAAVHKAKEHNLAYEHARAMINAYDNQIMAADRETNPYVDSVKRCTAEIDSLTQRITETTTSLTKYQSLLDHADMWHRKFPLIRLWLLDQIVKELEISMNQAFFNLGLVDWSVYVSTERELKNETTKRELNIQIKESDGHEWRLEQLSGGERQRVKWALGLGISDLIKSRCGPRLFQNLMMVDEPSASLSQEGLEDMQQMLSGLSQYNLILLADHRVWDVGSFSGVIELIKRPSGYSELSQDSQFSNAQSRQLSVP